MTDILNRETLNSLRELGDDFFLELIETFLDSSQTQMEALRKAIEEKSATGIEAAAHSLKGSCYGQGAEELGLLCKEMEAKRPRERHDRYRPFDTGYRSIPGSNSRGLETTPITGIIHGNFCLPHQLLNKTSQTYFV